MYEFNTRSGARRWKKSNEPLQLEPAVQVTPSATDDSGQGTDRVEASSQKKPSEKRKEPTAETKAAAKPLAGQSETSGQDGLRLQKQKEESEDRGLSSSAPQGRYWPPLPKWTLCCQQASLKAECMRLQGASQTNPALNSQRIRCDFLYIYLSCKT